METQVDMTYNFLQDDEPTDEQLLVIMKEVGEEARVGHEKLAKEVIEHLKREYTQACSIRQNHKA